MNKFHKKFHKLLEKYENKGSIPHATLHILDHIISAHGGDRPAAVRDMLQLLSNLAQIRGVDLRLMDMPDPKKLN